MPQQQVFLCGNETGITEKHFEIWLQYKLQI